MRFTLAASLTLALLVAPGALAQDRPPVEARTPAERFAAARQELLASAADLTVDGSTVGRGAQPGRFYTLVRELTRTGRKEDFLALVEHEQVVVRAAGMVCLAQRLPEEAVPVLRARQDSQAKLLFNPNGCTVEEITEGELATKLLNDADLLEGGHTKPRPLIPVGEQEKDD